MIFRDKFLYEKNNFVKMLKNVDTDLKIILLNHQNSYIKNSSNAAEKFDILATSLSALNNYFDSLKFQISVSI